MIPARLRLLGRGAFRIRRSALAFWIKKEEPHDGGLENLGWLVGGDGLEPPTSTV